MTIISGYAQLMAAADEADQREKYVEQIQRQFDLMAGMTREVLAFARGDTDLVVRKVYMNRFAEDLTTPPPNVQTDEGYIKGGFEVQDFGSQIVAALIGAKGNEQVLDLCAGAGGKSLAMAAAMNNKGQIFAYDSDRARLAPIYDRLQRSGVCNVQVRPPNKGALDDLVGKLDRVVIDAPCTGSGTWRRQPTAKWKLTPEQLAARVAEQQALLVDGARFVKPGGALVYITCSVLPEENARQADAFLAANADFLAVPGNKLWMSHFSGSKVRARFSPEGGISITPQLTGTDGFYIVQFQRGSE